MRSGASKITCENIWMKDDRRELIGTDSGLDALVRIYIHATQDGSIGNIHWICAEEDRFTGGIRSNGIHHPVNARRVVLVETVLEDEPVGPVVGFV